MQEGKTKGWEFYMYPRPLPLPRARDGKISDMLPEPASLDFSLKEKSTPGKDDFDDTDEVLALFGGGCVDRFGCLSLSRPELLLFAREEPCCSTLSAANLVSRNVKKALGLSMVRPFFSMYCLMAVSTRLAV